MAERLSDADIETLAEAMRTLGHETRLRLIDALFVAGEQSVGELETLTGIGQPGLSQQLAVLRKAALVNTRRAAKLVYYSVAPEALGPLAAFLSRLAQPDEAPAGERKPQPRARGSAATFAKIL